MMLGGEKDMNMVFTLYISIVLFNVFIKLALSV